MFGDGKLDELRTFVQKDNQACEIVDELWQWMMEKHIDNLEADINGDKLKNIDFYMFDDPTVNQMVDGQIYQHTAGEIMDIGDILERTD